MRRNDLEAVDGMVRKYSSQPEGSMARSEESRCRQPPPHREGKTAVLPRSAAKVETLA